MVNIVMSYTRLLCDHDILHKGFIMGLACTCFSLSNKNHNPLPPGVTNLIFPLFLDEYLNILSC